MKKFFGKKKSLSGKEKAIDKNSQLIEVLQKKANFIEEQINAEKAKAIANSQKNKNGILLNYVFLSLISFFILFKTLTA